MIALTGSVVGQYWPTKLLLVCEARVLTTDERPDPLSPTSSNILGDCEIICSLQEAISLSRPTRYSALPLSIGLRSKGLPLSKGNPRFSDTLPATLVVNSKG